MKFQETNYKGFIIELRVDVLSHCATIYKGGDICKMIAGNILSDGTTDVLQKSKNYIDSI